MVTKLFYVHVGFLLKKKNVPISAPGLHHGGRTGPEPGWTDTIFPQPRQWWWGQVTNEGGGLLTLVAAEPLDMC